MPYVGAEAFAGGNVNLVALEAVLEHLAGVEEVEVGFLASIKVEEDVDIAARLVFIAHSGTEQAQLDNAEGFQLIFQLSQAS